MAKTNNINMLIQWILAIAVILGGIAIGGLFTSGTTLNYPILNMFPVLQFHQLIGWILIGSSVLQALRFFGIVD